MHSFPLSGLAFMALLATTSMAQTPPVEVEGPISKWNRTARTFRATDEGRTYTVHTTSKTLYVADEGGRLTAAQFWTTNRNGRNVKVTGIRNTATVTATRVELDD